MSKVIYILEDEFELRSTLNTFLNQNGYDVHAFSEPSFCPLSEITSCACQKQTPCADFIITDINMPGMTGLKFIELQKDKGCKVTHIAIMSATWTEAEYQRARFWDCKVFEKPFNFADLIQWIKNCEEKPIFPANRITSCNRINIIE